MSGELSKVLWVCSILFMSDAFVHIDRWTNERASLFSVV